MSESARYEPRRGSAVLDPEVESPFLHDRGTVVYNPLTGISIPKDGEAFRVLSAIREGLSTSGANGALEHLRAARFLIEPEDRILRVELDAPD